MPYYEIPADPKTGEEAHRLHYNVFGQGPHRIVFIMGLGGTATQWEKQVEYFSQRGDVFTMLTIENRGIALSDSVGGRWTTAKMAKDVLSTLDHLGWTSNVHVVGLSMGGMIAQEVCKQGKGRFSSLTLLSTIAGGLYSLYYFLVCLPSGVRLVFQTNFGSSPKERLRSALKILYPDAFLASEVPDPSNPEKTTTNFKLFKNTLVKRAKEDIRNGVGAPSTSTILKQVLAVTTHNVSLQELNDISKSVNGNVLVVSGDDDILVHVANSERLAQGLKPKQYMLLNGAGHGAFEQCSDEVNQAIEQIVLNASSCPSIAKL